MNENTLINETVINKTMIDKTNDYNNKIYSYFFTFVVIFAVIWLLYLIIPSPTVIIYYKKNTII
jgi:hypothetical protein